MASTKNETSYTRVPELSLASYIEGQNEEREKFVAELFRGLKYFGFIILKDHPIDTELLDEAYRQSEAFFQLPLEIKDNYKSRAGGGQRGYTPFGIEHAKDNDAPDLKEFWHVGRDLPDDHKYKNDYPENIWPVELPKFKTVFKDFYRKLDLVGDIMLEALTGPLGVPANYFKDMTVDGNSILRLLHYPPIAENADPRCVRAAAHEDINLITILVSASASGLELLDRKGQWLPVETQKNNLIVDAGDMLARITNDLIPSTTHRVVNPNDGTNVSRFSMPYFIHPNPEAKLKCIESCRGEGEKYPEILAQDFLFQRLKEIGLS